MKVWLTCESHSFYTLYADEPRWLGNYWRSNFTLYQICGEALEREGFLPLPVGDECCEYSLGGKKPEWLCAWEPVKE